MPYLQLDLPVAVAPARRAEIAPRLAGLYAEVMQTYPERVTVGFRELGENGLLRLTPGGELETVLIVNCDIRRGRPPEQREQLGAAVAALLQETLGWPPERTLLEFTQHPGDEVWRSSGLGNDWTATEAS
jgi:phenylpyruvate tautomerase PptA (4-oxalocrotonate tautomerase family)